MIASEDFTLAVSLTRRELERAEQYVLENDWLAAASHSYQAEIYAHAARMAARRQARTIEFPEETKA